MKESFREGSKWLLSDASQPALRHLMAQLPTGTITFLFTDIEGSTRLWKQYPEAMRSALAARLLAAAAGLRESMGAPALPPGLADEEFVDTIRSALSEQTFTDAWAEGRAMTQ
jgi:hypothetical protein